MHWKVDRCAQGFLQFLAASNYFTIAKGRKWIWMLLLRFACWNYLNYRIYLLANYFVISYLELKNRKRSGLVLNANWLTSEKWRYYGFLCKFLRSLWLKIRFFCEEVFRTFSTRKRKERFTVFSLQPHRSYKAPQRRDSSLELFYGI